MKTKLFAISILLFCSCASNHSKDCIGKIVDLGISAFDDPSNKIVAYSHSADFVIIDDSLELIKYEPRDRIQYFFQPSKNDSLKRKFLIKVKPGIFRTEDYDLDLILITDNDAKGENAFYSLNSYYKDRSLIGHLDLAHWSQERNSYVSGRVDCDSSIHIILKEGKEHRIFKIVKNGEITLVEKKVIE